ncbi:MAG: MFS transporter [Chlorobiota bacterium]
MSARRVRWSWYMYDWANSAFPTTVLTVLLGPYLTHVALRAADASGRLSVLGLEIAADAYYPFLVSVSVVLQLLILPLAGAIADAWGWRKLLLLLFAYVGAAATVGLYWVEGDRYVLGGVLFVVANLCFGASIVMYNAFLPDIAAPHERDAVSSRGWAVGYAGGGTLLGLNLLFLSIAEHLGIATEHAVRLCLASAGVWWGIFTLIPAIGLPDVQQRWESSRGYQHVSSSSTGFWETLRHLRGPAVLFLAAYFFYNDGVQTVIALSGQFASRELGLPIQTITGTLLAVQFVALVGSLAFGMLAQRFGAKRVLLWSLGVWIAVLSYVALGLRSPEEFVVMAMLVGLVLGGTQALSRSLFSLYIPKQREAQYFSLYELSDRGSSWMGPLLFGMVLQWSGSYRLSVAVIAALFGIGGILLAMLRYPPRSGE